jgi:hypothetical protein
MSRPRALAVLRLSTVSYLVGACAYDRAFLASGSGSRDSRAGRLLHHASLLAIHPAAAYGTFETSADVRSTAAFGGNADISLRLPDNHRFMGTRPNPPSLDQRGRVAPPSPCSHCPAALFSLGGRGRHCGPFCAMRSSASPVASAVRASRSGQYSRTRPNPFLSRVCVLKRDIRRYLSKSATGP